MSIRKETARHRAAFEAFYQANRDFGAIWRNLAIPERTLRHWADAFDWHSRADLRDREVAAQAERAAIDAKAQEIAENNKAIAEMRKRHAQVATAMQSKLVQRLQTLDVSTLTPRDLAYWLDVSVKVERLARGEATEITDGRQTLRKRFEEMTGEELDAYIAERERHLDTDSALRLVG